MTERVIRRTAEDDLPEVFAIYERARAFMRANGNPTQWGSSRPAEETVRRDVAEGCSYLVCEDGRILGSALRFAESLAPSVRIDTHPDNAPVRHLLEREGFCRCGIIFTDDGMVRLAYQK